MRIQRTLGVIRRCEDNMKGLQATRCGVRLDISVGTPHLRRRLWNGNTSKVSLRHSCTESTATQVIDGGATTPDFKMYRRLRILYFAKMGDFPLKASSWRLSHSDFNSGNHTPVQQCSVVPNGNDGTEELASHPLHPHGFSDWRSPRSKRGRL